jgi:hypothetical protein
MKTFFVWSISAVLLIVLAGLYFWHGAERPEPKTAAAPAPPSEPAIRYPVESEEPSKVPLPELAESDRPLIDAINELFGGKMPKFLDLQNIVHRVVATVDNLPRDHVAPKLMPVKSAAGVPATETDGESLVLSSRNAARYETYVRAMDAVPTAALVALYARYYPLFQEQYERLGYPNKYFNDRAVEVIDHLLATPVVREPVELVQPRVLYEFADPKLEALSAGQKTLLRMGAAQRNKVKSKLQELRHALVSLTPKE